MRSEGPHAQESGDRVGGIVKTAQRRARPGTFLLETGYQVEGEDGLPVAAMSSNVGGMAAHWTGACPRPNDSERIAFLDDDGELDELLAEARAAARCDDRRVRQLALRAARARRGWPRPRTPGAIATTRVQRMPLAVHRRDDGRLVWSGSDVVLGDVRPAATRDFTLFDESLVTRVLVEDGRAAGVVVTDMRTGESSRGARAIRRRGGRRAAHPAAAVGLRHPSRRPRALPQRPGADRLRRAHPRLRARPTTARRRRRPD